MSKQIYHLFTYGNGHNGEYYFDTKELADAFLKKFLRIEMRDHEDDRWFERITENNSVGYAIYDDAHGDDYEICGAYYEPIDVITA